MGIQLNAQGINQGEVLFVDGADASKVQVMFGYFFETCAGYVSTAKDIFEKGDNVVGPVAKK